MTKNELIKRIEELDEERKILQDKLDNWYHVPKALELSKYEDEGLWGIGYDGILVLIPGSRYTSTAGIANDLHRLYPSNESKFIEKLNDKFQAIADLMWFKYNFDKDYEPEWENDNSKWYVYRDSYSGKWDFGSVEYWINPGVVYFSSKEIAEHCAEWLNSRLLTKEENNG